jgi:Fe-S cluster assembly ATPase SufC
MSFLIRVSALLLRIAMYYSPIAKKLSGIILFDQIPYSIENIKESKFLRNNLKMTQSEIYFNVWYY